MFNPIAVAVALVVILIGWIHRAIKPPPPKTCGSIGGPPAVTSPRVKLSDGRHLAYREFGLPKEEARYKIIAAHGLGDSKDAGLNVSQELIKDLGIYFLFYDRAGYGESDPNPLRSVRSEAYDIQELVDKLQIRDKFYIIGMSMGGYPAWSCLNYIPHRLLGVAFVAPFVNYWWPSFPNKNILRESFQMLPKAHQWTIRVAHYAPWLFYWWVTQKWWSTGQITLPPEDIEALECFPEALKDDKEKVIQQGVYESVHRDLMVGYGNWEFDPTEIKNPFPDNGGSVHIWHGFKDTFISVALMRYIAQKLPWIHYHELPDEGHMFIKRKNVTESIITALLVC